MSNSRKNPNLLIEDAKIIFKNFAGREGRFNPEGRRNFCVVLGFEDADNLSADGWNVRWLEPKDPDENKIPYLPVAVSYTYFAPRIVAIKGDKKTSLVSSNIHILDWADIQFADLIIRPSFWETGGKHGIKAYLKSGYFNLEADEFEEKYKNIPDSGSNAVMSESDDDDS